jgi:hypothetical protein
MKKEPLNNANILFRVRVKVLNATSNNILVILWPSVLLVEETGVPGENHKTVACH